MRRTDFDNPELTLAEMFRRWPETAAAFLERGMLCPGCPIAPFHGISDACNEYALNESEFRAELRRIARIPVVN